MPKIRERIVPTEAVQMRVKTMVGISKMNKVVGEKAKIAPIKVPNPLPPLNLRKIDQLWPIIAIKPART